MALIKCPECGQDVSDKAFSCPHCGYPFKKQAPVTIEQTRKKWKILKLIAFFLFILALYLIGRDLFAGNQNGTGLYTGIGVAVVAFILLLIGKIGAWWNNK
jgi:hypothetical protein